LEQNLIEANLLASELAIQREAQEVEEDGFDNDMLMQFDEDED